MGELLGCYVSASTSATLDKHCQELAFEKGKLFRNYIFGENGINNIIKKIDSENYGNDIKLILFEFYINPLEQYFDYINKGINYRKKEKSIGIPVIITDETFFNKSEDKKLEYIKDIIFEELNILSEYIKNKKIDIKIGLIIKDLQKEWNNEDKRK
jgi:hypothetical protein